MTIGQEKKQRQDLRAKVHAALRSARRLGPGFHLRELRLDPDGVVLLDGEVPDVAAKKLALERVAALPGIEGIADRLHVKTSTVMTDEEIRDHVRNGLIAEPSFASLEIRELDNGRRHLMRGAPTGARGCIDIEVEDGVGVLEGRVPGRTSERLAGVVAWWVPGARRIQRDRGKPTGG